MHLFDNIVLTDFLSFGPGSHTIELTPLNVLIGPNGSGKSNLVEAFSVLRAVPRDLPLPIRQGGASVIGSGAAKVERRRRPPGSRSCLAPGASRNVTPTSRCAIV